MSDKPDTNGPGRHGPIKICGIKAENPDQPPPRLEINEFKENEKRWNLLLLGLEKFQKMDETDPTSWFQIAGIHGYPFRTWPDEEWNQENIKKKDDKGTWHFRGFCTHSSILFLTWHRPYLALFEWALHKHITDIANDFNDPEYIEEAKKFRFPYWDWALPVKDRKDTFPDFLLQNVVPKVTRPNSKEPKLMEYNPLGRYNFWKSKGLPEDVFKTYDTIYKTLTWDVDIEKKEKRSITLDYTVRWPQALAERGVDKADKAMAAALDGFYRKKEFVHEDDSKHLPKGNNLTERTLYILQSYDRYKPMSNNDYYEASDNFENYGSLEDTHNSIHDFVGQAGQMGGIARSAFDPIFWLHHCNIDRLLAIWQALREEEPKEKQWVTETQTGVSSFTKDVNEWEGEKSPLYPFTNTDQGTTLNESNYWNSTQVKDTFDFGYSYPETQKWNFPTTEAYMEDVRKKLKNLYRGASLGNTANSSPEERANAVQAIKKSAVVSKLVADKELSSDTVEQILAPPVPEAIVQPVRDQVEARDPLDLIEHSKYLEWLVNVKGEKHSLNGRWALHVFIGEPDDSNPYLYQLAHNYVGTVAALGQSSDTGCEKCQKDQAENITITGQIPLTIALAERYLIGEISNLSPGEVAPYLKKNLYWRVTVGGTIVDRTTVGGLLVAVVTNEVQIPSDHNQLPIYSPVVVPRPEATNWDQNDGTGYRG